MHRIVLVGLLTPLLFSCSSLMGKINIEENHFRLENFKRDAGQELERIYLMCFHKKPTQWSEPKQFPSGEHVLWVRAEFSERGIPNSEKEAIFSFNVDLEPKQSYMLNRKINDDSVSVWIQEVATGAVVSEIYTQSLDRPLVIERNLRLKQCSSGTV